MCIAIYKPKDKIIPEETLKECFRRNSDGAGFAYISPTGLRINKGYFTFEAFYKAYKKLEQHQMLIHFRIKTHGAVAVENCHPFFVRHDSVFIHNGIISQHGHNTTLSDTRDFNEKILKPLISQFGPAVFQSPEIQALLGEYIGYSKLAFLDANGNFAIVNEDKGVWDDDVWYSNHSYKVVVYVPPVAMRSNGVSTWRPSRSQRPTTYYLKREFGDNIEEGDLVETSQYAFGIAKGTLAEVMYIDKSGKIDIKLPNGRLVQDFSGTWVDLYNPVAIQGVHSPLNSRIFDEDGIPYN